MIKHRGLLSLWIIVYSWMLCISCVLAAPEAEDLFSESTAGVFVRHAQQIYRQDPLDSRHIEQAMTFLNAALALDSANAPATEQILRTAGTACIGSRDYSEIITLALDRQMSNQADVHLLTQAVSCLLEQQNSRLDREVLLEKLLNKYAKINETFGSELATQLGLLAIEKADTESALDWLSYAYELNPYNRLAFIKLLELSAAQDLSVKPEVYLIQLRLSLDLDSYDLNNAIRYADTLKRMQVYDSASLAYAYAARVYEYLNPDKPLDESILMSWILSCYHVPRQESECIRVIEQYRDAARFNLTLEAVAGRAALKLGQDERGKSILEAAARKGERMLSQEDLVQPLYPEQLAWFYSFILPRQEEALAWASRAYKQAPQRDSVEPIFAYALAQSGQMELAKGYAEPHQQTNQIAAIVMAMAAIDDEDQEQALELLKSSIAMMPESFAAEKAKQLLESQGSKYVVPASVTLAESALEEAYPNRIIPEFITPQKRFSAKLFFSGSEFFYNYEFEPKLVIENITSAPLIIGPESFLQGRLQVDAALSGDVNVEIPNLLTTQFRPSRPILPGEHISVPLALNYGKLRTLLQTYPQADVDVAFTVYLDPVIRESGRVENALNGVEPVRGQIHRSEAVLTRDFLMQRLDSLAKGKQGQRIRAVQFFAGLLAELQAFEAGGANFQHVRVDPSILADAVRRGLRDEDWKVRVQAIDSLLSLGVPLNTGMIEDVSSNLNDQQWPVRMLAMVLLNSEQTDSFQQVLNWIAQRDVYVLNRRMALALGAQPQEEVAEQEPAEEEPIEEESQEMSFDLQNQL